MRVVETSTTVSQIASPTTLAAVSATSLPLARDVTSQQVQQAISGRESNVQDLSLPVYVNNELPRPDAESPLVIQTSAEARLDIITVNQQVIQLQDTEGFRLSVSATDAEENLSPVNARGVIVLEQNSFLTLTGQGFQQYSDIVAWLFSQPQRLGVVRVGVDGTFEESVKVGSAILPGNHTAQINGITADGELRSLNLAVEVVAPDAPGDIVTVTDTTIDPVITSGDGRDGSTSLAAGMLVLGVLLGAGTMWFLLARRRSTSR